MSLSWHSNEERNYVCLRKMVTDVVTKGLRKIFKQEWNNRYQATTGAWDDTGVGGVLLKEWDCALLLDLILYSKSIGQAGLNPSIMAEVNKLRELRNQVIFVSERTLPDHVFEDLSEKIRNSMMTLGLSVKELDEIKVNRECFASFKVLPHHPTHHVISRQDIVSSINDELRKLYSNNNGKLTYFYISGNHGSGKSQLARQIGDCHYNDIMQKQSESTFVMTLNGKTVNTLLESYKDFARRLNCLENAINSKKTAPETKVVQQLRTLIAMRIKHYKAWLIIVDNVEELKLVSSLLPQLKDDDWSSGQVLIITLDSLSTPPNSSFTTHLSVSKGMTEAESCHLLATVSGTGDHPMLTKVAQQLDYQPLALAAAAVDVKQAIETKVSPEFSWHDYLDYRTDMYSIPDRWPWTPTSVKHREKFEKLLEYGKQCPKKIQTVNGVRYCCNKEFLIGKGYDGTRVYIGLSNDGIEKAVKRLPKDGCGSLGVHEKNILNILDSIHVVRYWYYDENSNDEYAFLILDLCEETLTEYVSDPSRSLEGLRTEAPSIIRQILEGLRDLHGRPKPVLHRDLKPYNILRSVHGRWLLADFGISRTLEEEQTTHQSEEKGTKYWRAVESYPVKDETGVPGPVRYKTKSDIQVTGMVSFYILTKGQHPFGPEEQRVINLLNGNPVNLTVLGDPVAEDIISWMLKFNPEERPSAEEALKHPYFRSTAEQFELLSCMGNQPEVKQNNTNNNVVTKLNNDPILCLKAWRKEIDPTVLNYLCTGKVNRRRNGSEIIDYGSEWSECLRLIRNTAQHWNDRPRPRPEAHTLVGEPHVYFLKVFPSLPVVVHRIVRCDCEWKERLELKKFFA